MQVIFTYKTFRMNPKEDTDIQSVNFTSILCAHDFLKVVFIYPKRLGPILKEVQTLNVSRTTFDLVEWVENIDTEL